MPFAPVRTQAVSERRVPTGDVGRVVAGGRRVGDAVGAGVDDHRVAVLALAVQRHELRVVTRGDRADDRSIPQRISSSFGAPRPTAARLKIVALAARLTDAVRAPVSTATSLCSAVPGAMRWRSAHATRYGRRVATK
jgi:hypothetical protein